MRKLHFLKPILWFFSIGLLITTMSRFCLFLWFYPRISETKDFWLLFPIGLRMDVLLLSHLAVLPTLLILLLPNRMLLKIEGFIRYFLLAFLLLTLFMELATPSFLIQYDTRPNRLFIEYLIYPKEVFSMLFKGFLGVLVLAIGVLVTIGYFLLKKSKNWFSVESGSSYGFKLLVFPLVAFLLFFGARSSLTSIRPINASDAIFSKDQFTNSIALNSLYTVGYALYSLKHEEDMIKMYGKLPVEEALERVRKYMVVDSDGFSDPEIPTLHRNGSPGNSGKPLNLVIILEESIGAEYVGSLGGLPLTPNFDALTHEGLFFRNLYATGTRSVRGIEAVLTGFLPTPSTSVVKLGKAQRDFFSLAEILRRNGYSTSFLYGGSANFDNMASFFNGNGFEEIIDERDFKETDYVYKGTWGVCDESLFKKGNELFKSYGEKPFFALMFSSSNHEPFEFPDGKITLYDPEKATVNNAIKYADYAIGEFFKMAKKEDYYKNTVFLVIADHNTRTWGSELIPVNKFHIPALVIGPGIQEDVVYEKLCSQIDIPPTLLDLIGIDAETPMVGRDLLKLPDTVPGRAIMQFHTTNAFRSGNDLIVLQPHKEAVQFKVGPGDQLSASDELDTELAKDALSHVITASYLYNSKKYTLPKESKSDMAHSDLVVPKE